MENVDSLEKDFKVFVISGGSGIEEEESHWLDCAYRMMPYSNQQKLCVCVSFMPYNCARC